MKKQVWDNLSQKYDNLWVQKYSLKPSRDRTIRIIEKHAPEGNYSLLDLGCATGQFLSQIRARHATATLKGVDKSPAMIFMAKQRDALIEFECRNAEDFQGDMEYDFITCCHSFPYYHDKEVVLANIRSSLKDDGRVIFIHASVNNLYDRIIMTLVEKTAEQAQYLSKEDFMIMVADMFVVEENFIIRERWFMPSIVGFVLRKKL